MVVFTDDNFWGFLTDFEPSWTPAYPPISDRYPEDYKGPSKQVQKYYSRFPWHWTLGNGIVVWSKHCLQRQMLVTESMFTLIMFTHTNANAHTHTHMYVHSYEYTHHTNHAYLHIHKYHRANVCSFWGQWHTFSEWLGHFHNRQLLTK